MYIYVSNLILEGWWSILRTGHLRWSSHLKKEAIWGLCSFALLRLVRVSLGGPNFFGESCQGLADGNGSLLPSSFDKSWLTICMYTYIYMYVCMYSLTMVNGETIRWLIYQIYQIYQIYNGLTLVHETQIYFYWHLCNLCACYLTVVNSILTIHWMSILTAWSPVLPSLLWESPSFPGKTTPRLGYPLVN